MAVGALALLMLGILGLSLSNTSFIKNLGKPRVEPSIQEQSVYAGDQQPLLAGMPEAGNAPKPRPLLGMLCCLVLGIMNGSMMVPTRFTPKDASGISYVISFSIGVVLVTPVVAAFYFLVRRQMPVFHLRETLVPGLITGFIWSIGNFLSIYAVIYLGLTIGFPLTQMALVISGLWGLIVFRELSGVRTIVMWFFSVAVLLSGAFLLALSGR